MSFQRGVLPPVRRKAGRVVFRHSKATIEQSRTLRKAEFSTNSREVRRCGIRLTGREAQGALYLASLSGVVRERVHYAGDGGSGLMRDAVKLMPGFTRVA